jgi:hypothetical protein
MKSSETTNVQPTNLEVDGIVRTLDISSENNIDKTKEISRNDLSVSQLGNSNKEMSPSMKLEFSSDGVMPERSKSIEEGDSPSSIKNEGINKIGDYKCKHCGMNFSSIPLLGNHVRVSHTEYKLTIGTFVCEE